MVSHSGAKWYRRVKNLGGAILCDPSNRPRVEALWEKKRVRLVPVSRRPAPTSAEEASLCSNIFLLLFQFQFIKTCCLQKLYYSSTRYARSQGEVAHQTNHSRSLVARECTAHCFQDCFLGSGANVPEEPTTVSEYVKKKSSPSNFCPDIVLYRQGALR